MFAQDRQQLRQVYHDVWIKMQQNQPLSTLEQMIAEVIAAHPEYHAVFQPAHCIDQEYFVEQNHSNPYLHMALHLSLREQIVTDRPTGIKTIYQQLLHKADNAHECEHMMMECLAENLWLAQQTQQFPSDQTYLQSLQKLLV